MLPLTVDVDGGPGALLGDDAVGGDAGVVSGVVEPGLQQQQAARGRLDEVRVALRVDSEGERTGGGLVEHYLKH